MLLALAMLLLLTAGTSNFYYACVVLILAAFRKAVEHARRPDKRCLIASGLGPNCGD